MTNKSIPGDILFFDSGLGGLSVMREARLKIPDKRFIYVADDANFPYGTKSESELKHHILGLFNKLFNRFNLKLCIIACNTASTLVLSDLRILYPNCSFVGTVPAIKYAAEHTKSGMISVLATPATVKREYTKALIDKYATSCKVNLVGCNKLAEISERYLRTNEVDTSLLYSEIEAAFIKCDTNGRKTDIVVLACTHYPFLINKMRNLAPWPVDWIDPAEAIAIRAKFLLGDETNTEDFADEIEEDIAYFTSEKIDFSTRRLLQAFGLHFIT